MKNLKEIYKRFKWEFERFIAWLAFRVSVDPFTLFTGLPDGYTPYEKGYKAYESEKKRYEEKFCEYYARRIRTERGNVVTSIKSRCLIHCKKGRHQRKYGSHNPPNKPKYVNRYFIQRRFRKNRRNSAAIK
ncbi:hypothetical protein [Desulfovibrio sp. SGI.169]|uniref:hypothetical protein n=1 Tax=Desulfovibrio sp. SGI.169 TaxID=3420561 RepID=UPI003D062FD1